MTFDPGHAEDVVLSGDCLLTEALFPQVTGTAREELIRQ
jgi:hypothetical protein